MTHDPSQPDANRESDPRDEIGRLLGDALDVPPLRAEFAAALSQKLDREFQAAQHGTLQPLQPSSNGTHALAERPAADEELAATVTAPRYTRPAGHAAWRKIAPALAVATSLLIVIFVRSYRPTYSWAAMVQALGNQPWIQAVSESTRGSGVRGWISVLHGVVAVQSGDHVLFDDHQAHVRNLYRVDQRVIYQQALDRADTQSTEDTWLAFILHGDANADTTASARSIEILEQSWREIDGSTGRAVQLDVRVRLDGEPQPLELELQLDRATHLPQLCRIRRSPVEAAEEYRAFEEYRFDYPADGPRELYDIGVPRDAAIVRGTPAIQASILAPQAVESQPPPTLPAAEGADQSQPPAATTRAGAEVAESRRRLPATELEMAARIDELLAETWQQHGIHPVELASDFEFLRRVTLDLTGRIPHASEVRNMCAAGGPESAPASSPDVVLQRRARVLDDLLGRYDHATHLAAIWREFLLPDGVDLNPYGGPAEFDAWLTDHVRNNTPYDAVVRELLLAGGRVSEKGPLLFYAALKLEPEQIAAQSARAFLGVRLECAQCHDDFFDSRWKQEDFWGYAAFFARISRPQGKFDMVSPVMRIRDSPRGDVTLPGTEEIVGPRFPWGDASEDSPDGLSRRQRLAGWLTAPENPQFARATVNRVWAHLFGKGIVEPVDDMREDNPPICPELLDTLANYFVETGFDLRRLFRTLALTRAYQLTSRSEVDDPSRRLYFAQMNIKAFSAEQLYDSIAVATRLEPPAGAPLPLEGVARAGNMSRQAFLEQFRAPPRQATEFHSGIPQALTLMNGSLIHSATDLASSGLLGALEAPFFSDDQRLETLFLVTLSRPPDDEERQTMGAHLAEATSAAQRGQALGDILWALLNSAEFTLNH